MMRDTAKNAVKKEVAEGVAENVVKKEVVEETTEKLAKDAVEKTTDDITKTATNIEEKSGTLNSHFKWKSKDPLVGDVANAIDDAIPGKVSDVNKVIRDPSGRTITDLDIELDDVVIQVKSGGGKGLTTQLETTAKAIGKEVIGYVPNVKPSILKGASAKGFKVFTKLDDMINYLKGVK